MIIINMEYRLKNSWLSGKLKVNMLTLETSKIYVNISLRKQVENTKITGSFYYNNRRQ